jgi:hypothetical protein
MVKARIMANRRRLLEEDQTDAATQPVQTLQSIDARGNRWGEEEPAGVLYDTKAFNVAAGYFRFDSDQNALTVSTADYSASTTVSVPTVAGSDAQVEWWLSLPAGGNKMVLAFYCTSVKIDYTYEDRESSDGFVESSPNEFFDGASIRAEIDATAQAAVDDYISFWDGKCVEPITDVSECQIFAEPTGSVDGVLVNQDKTSTKISYPYSRVAVGVTTGFSEGLIVFLVSKNSVSRIDPPNAFRNAVFSRMYSLQGIEVSDFQRSYTVTKRHLVNYFVQITRTRTQFFVDSGYVRVPVVSVIGDFPTQETEEQVTDVIEKSASPSYTNGGSPPTSLLRSYGYGYLVDRGEAQSPGWGWTPAIFAFLRKYDPNLGEDTNYQSIRNQYLGNDAPSVALTLGYEPPGSQPGAGSFYHYFTIPTGSSADFSDPVDFSSSSLNLRRVTRGTRTNPILSDDIEEGQGWDYDVDNPVKAWDWGKPNACIGELLALGFTAEQLGYTGQTPPAGFAF